MRNVRAALVSLTSNWQRACLSALGIMVGSVAVVLLVSIAKGVQADITDQVHELGVNVLVVIPGRIETGSFNPNLGGQSFLKEADGKELAKLRGVVSVAPWTFVGGGIKRGDKVAAPILVATTPAWFKMTQFKIAEGRGFQDSEDREPVCVIGSVAKESLFGTESALGQTVTINRHPYRIVGVTKDRGSEQSLFSMGSLQNLVYIPYHYFKQIQPDAQTDRIMVQIQPDVEPRTLIKRMDAVLERRLDRQQFQVLTQEDLLGLVYKLMSILTWLLTGLTSIALFVGGVGIMAVMLMSTNERSREIGIRKAVGAQSVDIFVQFLTESILIAITGGCVGLALSWAVCLGLREWTPIKPLITWWIVGLALLLCVGVGAVFGLIPALRASKKDPVAALREQ